MKCLTYYASKDPKGFPIPGTMKGLIKEPCGCALIELPTEERVVEEDEVRVFHPNRLRFFVRVDCNGGVVPNSLFSSRKHPGGNVIEFKKILTV